MDDHWDDPRQLTFDFYLQSDRNQAGGDRNQSSDRQDLNNSMAPIADSLNTPQPLEAAKPKRKADALESSKASYLTDSSPTTENGLDKNPMAGPTMTYQLKPQLSPRQVKNLCKALDITIDQLPDDFGPQPIDSQAQVLGHES
ncbi:hypothetical protein L3556_00020 [Candidatus Synechococcus calcipolaris G9]|uniref:Uncharacterized protein n=1 Tax=Candidatus Synechococcus calcipolaris G9 TaxID=1497997 RepID=A0ABT6ETQ3_9SYNE|nr:hypothetical protein [Candidatus Synechococcus calcipolaris]MDG2989322.1 hypothetical protein [Candidatus Synechococcus calcipolaris G9]